MIKDQCMLMLISILSLYYRVPIPPAQLHPTRPSPHYCRAHMLRCSLISSHSPANDHAY